MCSSLVWSRCESPGPYVTMGTLMVCPRVFMSPVPVLWSSVTCLFLIFLIEMDNDRTKVEVLSASKGSFESSTYSLIVIFGFAC